MTLKRKRRIIIDTDVGFDDLLALQAFTKTFPDRISLLTTVHGASAAATGARALRRLFVNHASSLDIHAGIEEHAPCSRMSWLPHARKLMDSFCETEFVEDGDDDNALPPLLKAKQAIRQLLQDTGAQEAEP